MQSFSRTKTDGNTDRCASQTDHVILLGNSLNLLEDKGKKWEEIVSECETAIEGCGYSSDEERSSIKKLSLTFRMSRFFNLWQLGGNDVEGEKRNTELQEKEASSAFNKLCRSIAGLGHNEMHTKLWEVIGNSPIITTNYDYAIEHALGQSIDVLKRDNIGLHELMREREFAVINNLSRHNGQVWHMHGEANEPGSVIIDNDSYSRGLAALKYHGNHESTWLNLFLYSNVHILGLELDYSESLLWYALQLRLQLPICQRKDVYFYYFVNEEDEAYISKITLLDSYKVTPVRINVSDDYRKAWVKALKKLKQNMSMKKTDFPDFRSSNPAYNIVSSASQTYINPERCWMNIGVKKLSRFNKNDHWIFDCNVAGERYVYTKKVGDLNRVFKSEKVNKLINGTERYSFYIDYKKGKLYLTGRSKEPIIQLDEVKKNREEYESLIRPLPPKARDISFPIYKKRWKYYNITTSSSPTATNPSRCWMNIVESKLDRYADDKYWLFDCNVDGQRRVYSASIKVLRLKLKALKEEGTNFILREEKFSFYIDHLKGVLYTSEYESSGCEFLVLDSVQDGNQYEKLMINMS